MSEDDEVVAGIRERVSRLGEEALGNVAHALLDNEAFTSAVHQAMGARERAVQAQQAAMGALNLPSAADMGRLERRVRSVFQRLESLEDEVDRIDSRLAPIPADLERRMDVLQEAVESIAQEVGTLSRQAGREEGVSSDQERLEVSE